MLIQIAEFNADDWLSPSVRMPEDKKFDVIRNENGCAITFAHPGGGTMKIILNRDETKRLCDELAAIDGPS